MTFLSPALLYIGEFTELTLIVKASGILAVGLLLSRLLRRSSAPVRHIVLASAFAAVLMLPFVSAMRPEMTVRVPAVAAPVTPRPATPVPSVIASSAPATSLLTGSRQELRVSGLTVARTFWACGALFFLLKLCLGLWHLRHLRRSGLPWPTTGDLARAIAVESGFGRRVDVVVHEAVACPITFGARSPLIVLPPDAHGWSKADLRRALVHELEHVRRYDWVTQTLARAICALWWFHPLIWIAWQGLSLEAERSCDDAVVAKEEGMGYAEQLVQLARRLAAVHGPVTLGMANRSDLSARVSAILDSRQRRGRPGPALVVTSLAAASALLLAVAPVRVAATVPGGATVSPGQSAERQAAPVRKRSRALDRDLYEAAHEGDVTAMTDLIAAGANVDAAISGDGSPLIGAARSGSLDALRLLLDRGANPNLGVHGDGSALIVASDKGKIEAVRLLLDRGANPNLGVDGDGSPLIAAAASGRTDVVSLLLDRGATIDLVVPGDENPLIQASAAGQLAAAKLLVARGADVNARVSVVENGREEVRTPLSMARRGGHKAVVEFLVSAGARD